MPPRQEILFNEGSLTEMMSMPGAVASQYVDKIPKEQFLAASEEELIRHVQSVLSMEPLTIHEDRMTRSLEDEVRVDVSHMAINPEEDWGVGPNGNIRSGNLKAFPGIKTVVRLPFTGDARLWRISPSRFWITPQPHGRVTGSGNEGYVEMVFEFPIDTPPAKAGKALQENLKAIREEIAAQRLTLKEYHDKLSGCIRMSITARRKRLENAGGIAAAFNIPIEKRPDVPNIAPIPVPKRIVAPLPSAPQGGQEPEPGITDNVYEDILSVIRHESCTFEQTRSIFAGLGEEDLRNLLLAHLNGYFKGAATGETFRGQGKTDIRIEAKNRAAFVAECKIWEGIDGLSNGIDQLLGYLTWRDCKTAIVLYNKRVKEFATIQKRVPLAFASHSRFVKAVEGQRAGEWRFVLRSKYDDTRLLRCHVFAFDLFVGEDRPGDEARDATSS